MQVPAAQAIPRSASARTVGTIGLFVKVCPPDLPISLPSAVVRASSAPRRRGERGTPKTLGKWLWLASVLASLTSLCGCTPFGMGVFTPVPMQPWVSDRIEERLVNKNDNRTPILPPIPPGHRPYCEDPPDQQEMLRVLPRVTRGVPYIYEEFRDDIEFTVEKLVDRVDPPRFFPLIGPAQLHHCHWKCTVYYTETIPDSSYPFPFSASQASAGGGRLHRQGSLAPVRERARDARRNRRFTP